VTVHELLDQAADEALSGLRVRPDVVRDQLHRRRVRRARRGAALLVACLLVLLPLAGAAASHWSAFVQPAGPSPARGLVVPDRLPDLDGAPPLLEQVGEARRLSMAFLGSVGGDLTPVALDASSGRPFRLPGLADDVPGVVANPADATLAGVVPTAVSLSADGRTVAVSNQDAGTALDVAVDVATGRGVAVRQEAPTGRAAGEVLCFAALDGGVLAVPNADLTGVDLHRIDGATRSVRLPGLDASRGLVLEPQSGATLLVTARRGGRDWMWRVDARTGAVDDFAAPWLADTGWAASQSDGRGHLVALANSTRLVRLDPQTGTATPLGSVAVSDPDVDPKDLRVVSAGDGHVVLVDDGRQRTARFVAGAQPHRLLEVTANGQLRTLTDLGAPAAGGGLSVSSFAVAQDVVAVAGVVPAPQHHWWQSRWWLLLVPLGLVLLALTLRRGGSAATAMPWQQSGPPAHW
jgi:hypothetical protein